LPNIESLDKGLKWKMTQRTNNRDHNGIQNYLPTDGMRVKHGTTK